MSRVGKLTPGEYDAINAVLDSVDTVARTMDEKWGAGRLPKLVGTEWAAKFGLQREKFSKALYEWNLQDSIKHGAAMERAYAKLDELATAAGASTLPPEQWEFDVDGELVILVRDIRDTGRAQRHGRKCQVWSLDEIANVIRAHPALAAAKHAFPGAKLEPTRPARDMKREWQESADALPF